jgi:cobalt-zinc-cadmium efflux system membrane fusion protein
MSKLPLISLIACTILLFSCEKPVTDTVNSSTSFCIPDSLMKNISLDTLHSSDMMSELRLAGKITFDQDKVVQIYPFIGGHVSDVKVSIGDYVKKGQLLATINSPEMAGYSSEHQAARSELEIAKKIWR